jgi:hypothetical protein
MISGLIAHFTAMKHAPVDHLPPQLKPLALQLRTAYDMAHHNLASGGHLSLVDDDFVRWFAICGPPALCIDRLGELAEMGLDHLYVLNGSPVDEPHGAKWEAAVNELDLFAAEVMPALRR